MSGAGLPCKTVAALSGRLRQSSAKNPDFDVLFHCLHSLDGESLDQFITSSGLDSLASFLRSPTVLPDVKQQALVAARLLVGLPKYSKQVCLNLRLVNSVTMMLTLRRNPHATLVIDFLKTVLLIDELAFEETVLHLQLAWCSTSMFAPLLEVCWELADVRDSICDLLFAYIACSTLQEQSKILLELNLLNFASLFTSDKTLQSHADHFHKLNDIQEMDSSNYLSVECDPTTSLNATFKMRFDEDTTIDDVISYIRERFTDESGVVSLGENVALSLDECGIYFPGLKRLSGVWGLRPRRISDFHIRGGALRCIFGISPIPVRTMSVAGFGSERLMVDMRWTVDRLRQLLITRYLVDGRDPSFYHVFLERSGAGFVWLMEPQMVLAKLFTDFRSESSTLRLQQAPKEVDVLLGNKQGVSSVPLDLMQRVEDFVRLVCNNSKLAQTSEHSLYMLIGGQRKWIDPSLCLKDIGVSARSQLGVDLQPRPILVSLDDDVKEFMFIFNYPVSKLQEIVTDRFEIAQAEKDGYCLRIDPGSRFNVYSWESLNKQGIKYGDTLLLVKRDIDPVQFFENAKLNNTFYADKWINEDVILDKEGDIEAASLNALFKHLTSLACPLGLVHSILRTYRSFMKPLEFLEMLIKVCDVPNGTSETTEKQIMARLATILKHWVTQDIHLENGVIDCIRYAAGIIYKNESHSTSLGVVRQSIIRAAQGASYSYRILTAPPPSKLPKALTGSSKSVSLKYTDISPLEIARQLTLPVSEAYGKIKAEEFFQTPWAKEKTQHLAPNIMWLINSYNRMAQWVATSIVTRPKLRSRVKMFQHQLAVANELKELQNFHCLSAFVSGFNNAGIIRLKWTQDGLQKKFINILEDLSELTNMQGSFKNLRAAVVQGSPPIIPYLGVYLADFTFIEDGNPDTLKKERSSGESVELINVGKRTLFYHQLEQIQQFQEVPYNLKAVWILQDYLFAQPVLDDKELYKQSLVVEPREAEKGDIK